jgi:hypothetical protein
MTNGAFAPPKAASYAVGSSKLAIETSVTFAIHDSTAWRLRTIPRTMLLMVEKRARNLSANLTGNP